VTRVNAQPDPHEADVVWRLDMMEKLGSRQHNNSTCCVTIWKETLFVCTGNGVDEGHVKVPAPDAPSFAALDKSTGKVLWTSNLPGLNIHHGNWSSPAVGMLGGVPQVIFNGGDGWTYSFHAEEWHAGQPKLLWKFDTNAKVAILELGGRGTRNEPIGAPVLHEDRVYITTGQDAEHGEGPACIWCLDPTKRGDVSAELAVLRADPTTIVPHDRIQAVQPDKGQVAIANPNSAVFWQYGGHDRNSDGQLAVDEQMHRTLSPVVIAGDLLFANDFTGFVHCLDRKTGRPHWTYDALAAIWAPPMVADGKVYSADEDGDIAIFLASADPAVAGKRPPDAAVADRPAQIEPVREINMLNSCYTQPTASKGVLFIASKDHLFAIEVKQPTP
jgi:outer membrane protein assembly factor BamB